VESSDDTRAARDQQWIRDLLSDDADVRDDASAALVDEGLAPGTLATIFVVKPLRDRKPLLASHAAARAQLEDALVVLRGSAGGGRSLHLSRPDHGVLLVSADEPEELTSIGQRVRVTVIDALSADGDWDAVVGIGDPATPANVRRSYDEARKTADLCTVLSPAGPVARWSELGVYQLLLELPLTDVNVASLHPGLSRLLASRDAQVWLETLETYLDLGCDARGAAKALDVNRSSLYHRIHRIEDIAGVDLGTGDDRLVLHLGLKLARLNGLF
jgi:sugar diacid utilization regulator